MRSRNHCCRGKAVTITYSECVSVALAVQHAKRMRPIIFSFVACLDLPYFSTLSHKSHDFGKKSYEHKFCVLIFSTNFVWIFRILRRIQRDININVCTLHLKCPLHLPDFNLRLIISTKFRKILKFRSHEKPCCRIRVVLYGCIGRKEEANSTFSQFYECA